MMYFLHLKTTGAISPPIRTGEPDDRTLDKQPDCGIGGGIKWENVDLFYSPDEEFPEDFKETAPLGKYFVDGDEIKETPGWTPPPEEPIEWR